MTKRTLALALLAALPLAGPLLAHGGFTHVLGTVTVVEAGRLEVKNKAGKLVSVKLTEATKYTRSGAAAAAKDIQVGQRVAVEAKPKGEELEAVEVKLGVVPAKPEAPK
jgi:Domain of unknown function (DUF5666)